MRSYDLTVAAEEDLRDIWIYTYETWGLDQAERSFDQIEVCCETVGNGRARSRTVTGLPDDVHIHCCEYHYIVWLTGGRPVIIAILHERMDFVRRLKDRL
jgi:toxin ParE1/3/4